MKKADAFAKTLRSAVFCCVLLPLFLSGCIRASDEYFINPDGSGKVNIVREVDFTLLRSSQKGENTPELLFKKLTRDFFAESEGFSAWKDIDAQLADGRTGKLTATGYFKDYSLISMKGEDYGRVWKASPGGVVEVGIKAADEPAPPPAEKKELSGEEIAKAVRSQKDFLKGQRALFEPFFTFFEIRQVFHFSSPVQRTSNMKKSGECSAEVLIDRASVTAFFDMLEKDDKHLREIVVRGKGFPGLEEVFHLYFGNEDGITATAASSGSPLFDFVRESEEALAGYRQWQEKNPVKEGG
jgi:hypothetical protein